MAKPTEMSRRRSLLRRYRRLVDRLIQEGGDYTSGEYCVFCSGTPGAKAANETEDGQVRHSRGCPTRRADKLAAEII
ncbi:MAG: hypothetical protein NTY36_01475 [Deltaproteobacteria bacterium]|nr:hypothetical protein [Deltaproteobacteria bacterium]